MLSALVLHPARLHACGHCACPGELAVEMFPKFLHAGGKVHSIDANVLETWVAGRFLATTFTERCKAYGWPGQMLGEGPMHPKTDGILESSLYVRDVSRSVRFYEEVFGFRVISNFGERGCAMHAGARQVLLLFKKGASCAMQSPPPHDGDGELHVAFAIPSGELANWERWLRRKGIAVEEKQAWPSGGWSLYFRDPDRHLVELVTPGTWSVY